MIAYTRLNLHLMSASSFPRPVLRLCACPLHVHVGYIVVDVEEVVLRTVSS